MSTWAVVALLLSHLVVLGLGFGLSCLVRGRRRYNAGVAAGRKFTQIEHGLPPEDVRPARSPRRFLIRSNRKPDPEPLVTRDTWVPLVRSFFPN